MKFSQYEIKSLHYCGIIIFVQYLPGNIRIRLIHILTKGKERFLQHIKCKWKIYTVLIKNKDFYSILLGNRILFAVSHVENLDLWHNLSDMKKGHMGIACCLIHLFNTFTWKNMFKSNHILSADFSPFQRRKIKSFYTVF